MAKPAMNLTSPSGNLEATITQHDGRLTYTVIFHGASVIDRSAMGILVDGKDYATSTFDPSAVKTEAVNTTYPLLGVKSIAHNVYNGASIPMTMTGTGEQWTLEARAYDDGFAFRYILPGEGERIVQGETTSFVLPEKSTIWYFERKNHWKLKSYAGEWLSAPLSEMPVVSGSLGPVQGLPLVVELPQGGYALLTDAACWDFTSLRAKAVGDNTFVASLADDSFKLNNDITTPWRVIICAEDLNTLVNSTLITDLAPPPDPDLYADTSYIRPGRSAWRWWSSGTGNPEQERQYIDYAAALGFEYSTVDDGWKDWPDAWSVMAELCAYGREKDVGVFLWVHSRDIRNPRNNWAQLRDYLDKVVEAGAVGIKTDFMNSDGKAAIDFEIAALKLAAERKLLVNFHGCHKPTGEARTFPNEVTREGIRGLELNRMPEGPITPQHNAALPFTRFVVGHGDYTPFTVNPRRLGETTLAHQLATVVCFTSPLQVIAENPALLLKPEFEGITAVLKLIPSVWDETRVLPGSNIGDLAVMARRKDDIWFIAALNGKDQRSYSLDLSFLGDKATRATVVRDVIGTPTKADIKEHTIQPGATLEMELEKGGGFVLLLSPCPERTRMMRR
jgi:alpha-glucosidase